MNKTPPHSKSNRKNWLEWSVFGLSAAILMGVCAVLAYQSFTIGEEPAHLLVRLGNPLVSGDQVRIPVSVMNQGDQPAISVVVEIQGILAGTIRSSSLKIDHVARRSSREGWVSFPGHLTPSDLSARVLGYLDP